MIATATTLRAAHPYVARKTNALARLDALRSEAMREMEAAFDGISGKRIDAVSLPGFGRHGVSRAINGADSNPLYRIAGLLLLMKRLGMGRTGALRWLEWLRQVIDSIWPPEEEADLREVLDRDAKLDGMDELPRQRAYAGDADAKRELLAVKTAQIAVEQEVCVTIRRELAMAGQD